MTRSLVVKVTCGSDDAERCNQGFMVATMAVTAGAEVSLWLAGEACHPTAHSTVHGAWLSGQAAAEQVAS